MAKCMIASISVIKGKNKYLTYVQGKETNIIAFLQKAGDIFHREGNVEHGIEVSYLMARVYDSLGLKKERNEAAKQFRELNEKKCQKLQEIVPHSLNDILEKYI